MELLPPSYGTGRDELDEKTASAEAEAALIYLRFLLSAILA